MRTKEKYGTAEARAEASGGESRNNDNGGARKRVLRGSSEKGSQPLDHGDAVEAINAELKKQNGSNLKIGEIVDGEIGPKGRADYGRAVLKTLAEDPDLQCSGEHLRQCWHVFRLDRDHGARLKSEFSSLRFGHVFQLSRLLGLEEDFGADPALEAVFSMAKKAINEGRHDKPMPADTLAKAVTTHIKSIKGRGLNDNADQHEGLGDKKRQADMLKAIEDDHASLNEGIEKIQIAAANISGSGRYDHVCTLQTNVERIAQAHVKILGHIVRNDPQSMVIPMARKHVRDLAVLVGLTVVETGISGQGEVSP